MDFWRVRCSKCGKTFAPLAKFIGLECYQTKSNELEKLVIEAVSGNNYRRATKIARIILKRFTNAKAWEDYWQNKMNCVGNVVVNIGNYKCFSQNLGQ